ncbi:SgcJ/EcaC family oxidoreductase [Actinopolymorpha sp. B17G11]|uniref:SgcJ/EcaC family oxidoreductase n=1 Tax=Actinopolymorpha sp. B17G11 TaxID=3160861 RepID=UPI0032E39588
MTATDTVAGPTAADEQAIRELVERADEAQSDTSVLPGLHTSEAVIVNIAGRRLFGRDAFSAAMSAALGSALKDVRTSVEVVDIRGLNPDVALVSCVKTVHDNRPDAEADVPASGALTYTVVKTPAGWQVALAQTTPIR